MTRRQCAICNKQTDEGCATFLSVLMRWDYFKSPERTNQFAHPSCVRKEQLKRAGARRGFVGDVEREEGQE